MKPSLAKGYWKCPTPKRSTKLLKLKIYFNIGNRTKTQRGKVLTLLGKRVKYKKVLQKIQNKCKNVQYRYCTLCTVCIEECGVEFTVIFSNTQQGIKQNAWGKKAVLPTVYTHWPVGNTIYAYLQRTNFIAVNYSRLGKAQTKFY